MECGEDTIEVVFLTESVFQGRIYVVGHSNDGRCVSRDTGRRTTSITVRKDQCGVAITRSVSSFIISGLHISFRLHAMYLMTIT